MRLAWGGGKINMVILKYAEKNNIRFWCMIFFAFAGL